MAWIPSHQELRDHPKARKASRHAGVSLPQMVGHLHMLWWWALDHAPDGDLSKYDADDLADAAMWEGDPETLVKALRDCGPGESEGFLTDDHRLHDWDEYGGKYGQRVEAARKAAAARWHPNSNADALPPDSEGNADASGGASDPQTNGNAEESRGDKSRKPSTPPSGASPARGKRLPEDWHPEQEPELVKAIGGQQAAKREWAKFRDYWLAKPGKDGRKTDWQATWRNWLRRAAESGPSKARASPPPASDVTTSRRLK